MIEIENPREKAVLVGVPPKGEPAQTTEEHLEELGRLADTAGVDLLGTLVQRLENPNPRLYLGEGKAGYG